jgi:hypothetical protein
MNAIRWPTRYHDEHPESNQAPEDLFMLFVRSLAALFERKK